MKEVRLHVVQGPARGRSCVVKPGQRINVGNGPTSGFRIDDPSLGHRHFSVHNGLEGCLIQDLGGAVGIKMDGVPVFQVLVADRCLLQAGVSLFAVDILVDGKPRGSKQQTDCSGMDGDLQNLIETVSGTATLYTLLDAARDEEVLFLLDEADGRVSSLYRAHHDPQLVYYGPFLVEVPPGSAFLTRLLERAWGLSWGVFLLSEQPFGPVLAHLRSLLWVKTQAQVRKALYFRYYDPRVLRDFLSACDSEVADRFFGPVTTFLMEGKDPESLLQVSRGPKWETHQVQGLVGHVYHSS